MKRKGFTLIELLVVIAIIGILASIVLVSLSGARNRAHDARIQSDLNQVRTQAEVYRGTQVPESYTGLAADTDIAALAADVTDQAGAAWTMVVAADAYCVYSQLASDGTKFYCVDWKLGAATLTGAPTATCNATDCTAGTCACQ
ncbi:MAG: type II secretion system protein [bacterium]